ncbi:MAG: hypothetical protein K2Z81_09020 [Cyanobacteria bacterium]|nr:hypothetical protein [Cyanobacteriota bacterium]
MTSDGNLGYIGVRLPYSLYQCLGIEYSSGVPHHQFQNSESNRQATGHVNRITVAEIDNYSTIVQYPQLAWQKGL